LLLCTLSGMEKALDAERETLAHEALNNDFAEMRANYLASRVASKAHDAALKSQNTQSTEARTSPSAEPRSTATQTGSSSGPGSQPPPPNASTPPEPALPRPPRTYAEVCS
jgi:hypothetical protein